MDHKKGTPTFGSSEESIEEAGNDALGVTKPVRDATSQGDGSTKTGKPGESVQPAELDPSSSGTTSLGGEPRDGESLKGPAGVEGESGTG